MPFQSLGTEIIRGTCFPLPSPLLDTLLKYYLRSDNQGQNLFVCDLSAQEERLLIKLLSVWRLAYTQFEVK
jgi:hypothetical protein